MRAGCPRSIIPLLRGGREFRRELGVRSSIPAVSIFGYGMKTIASVTLQRSDAGEITKIDYRSEPTGNSIRAGDELRAGGQRDPPGAAVPRLAVRG